MKQKQTLSINELCHRLNTNITAILNLAISRKVPLWLLFDGVDCYEEQLDGSMKLASSNSCLDVMPAPEVLNTLIKIQTNQSDILSIEERINDKNVLTAPHNHPFFKEKAETQKVNLDTTPYQILVEGEKKGQILYSAFPAQAASGATCILKQTIRFIEREWDDSGNELEGSLHFHSHYPIIFQLDDLFAYEDDADEYHSALNEDYAIGEKQLSLAFGKSYGTVKTWTRDAGFKFDRSIEGDGNSSPMLKYSDIQKIKLIKKSQKDKKKK